MRIKDIIEEYELIKDVHKGKSIEKLWSELEIFQKHISDGIMLGCDISDSLKESLVLSDLIRKKSEKCRKRFLKKLRKEVENSLNKEEFYLRVKAMNFFGEEYVYRTYY